MNQIQNTESSLKGSFGRRGEKHTRRSERVFKRIVPYINEDLTILDLGGCDGKCAEYFINSGFGKFQILDLSLKAVKIAASKDIIGLVADAYKLPYKDNSFEVVLMIHVLEHCPKPWIVEGEICRVLNSQGILYVEVPQEEPKKVPTKGCHYSFFPRGFASLSFKTLDFGLDGNNCWSILRNDRIT